VTAGGARGVGARAMLEHGGGPGWPLERWVRRLRVIPVGALLALAFSGCASAQPSDPAARPAEVPAGNVEMLESTRRSVRSTAEWLARGVDSWFGDKPFREGGKVTDGQLSVGLLKRQDESMDVNVRFNARFRLPNLEANTYLFFGRDNQRELITDKPGAFSRQQRLLPEAAANQSFFAGLGLWLHDSVDARLGFRGGLKNPYAQVRYRSPWQLSDVDLVEFRQTLFWSLDERFGSTTAFSYEHAFSSTRAVRWLSVATITQESGNFEWSSVLGAYQSFGGQRLLGLEALISGEQGSGVGVSDYGLQARWEQPVYKNWLLGELVVGHFWPRKDALIGRGRAWALGAALKMQF